MWEDLGYLLFITAFFVAVPMAVDAVVLWRLNHPGIDSTRTPTRSVIGYLGLAANFFAIAIAWGTFYANLWFSNHHSDTDVGRLWSYNIAVILALSSLIFGFMAPKSIRSLLVIAGL